MTKDLENAIRDTQKKIDKKWELFFEGLKNGDIELYSRTQTRLEELYQARENYIKRLYRNEDSVIARYNLIFRIHPVSFLGKDSDDFDIDAINLVVNEFIRSKKLRLYVNGTDWWVIK